MDRLKLVIVALGMFVVGTSLGTGTGQAQPFVFEGHSYCWSDDGWRGPGWYRCGYEFRRGLGWGGPRGWRGWGGGVEFRERRGTTGRGGAEIRERGGTTGRGGAEIRERGGTTGRGGAEIRERSGTTGRGGAEIREQGGASKGGGGGGSRENR